MFKKALLAVALVSAFGVAQASNNNGCQGNCPGGNTTNNITNAGGQGGSATGGTGVGIGVGIGQGGQGGQGGAGGNAIGVGGEGGRGGAGGSVLGSGNSANNLDNKQKQGQAQGQLQGQGQHQSARSNSDARSNANNAGNRQTVNVQGDSYEAARIPAATAYAAPLAASNGTCMGSSSAGFQGMSVGISLGSTWNDTSCDMRYDAEALRQAGMPQAAVARLCQKTEIAQAMDAAGTPCPKAKVTQVAATSQTRAPTTAEKTAQYTGTDPIVRRRLGLPPL